MSNSENQPRTLTKISDALHAFLHRGENLREKLYEFRELYQDLKKGDKDKKYILNSIRSIKLEIWIMYLMQLGLAALIWSRALK